MGASSVMLMLLAVFAWVAAIGLGLLAIAFAAIAMIGWLFDREMTRWMQGL